MTINMDDSHLVSVTQIKEFLKITALVNFKGISRKEKYQWVENAMNKFRYLKLGKNDKGIVRNYIMVDEVTQWQIVGSVEKISEQYLEVLLEDFNPYLNYHRPSCYPTVSFSDNGKRRKIYDICMVPYEKLKSLEDVASCLRHGITFEILDAIAYEKSDNEYATLMQEKKKEVFNNLKK